LEPNEGKGIGGRRGVVGGGSSPSCSKKQTLSCPEMEVTEIIWKRMRGRESGDGAGWWGAAALPPAARNQPNQAVFIGRIRMFLGLLDTDPLVICTDLNPARIRILLSSNKNSR